MCWCFGRPAVDCIVHGRRLVDDAVLYVHVVEVTSVIKRKWGETLKNRTLPSQARELGFRILLHNARERLKKDIMEQAAKLSSTGQALPQP